VLRVVPQPLRDLLVEFALAGVNLLEVSRDILGCHDPARHDTLRVIAGEIVAVLLQNPVRLLLQVHSVQIGCHADGGLGLAATEVDFGPLDRPGPWMKTLFYHLVFFLRLLPSPTMLKTVQCNAKKLFGSSGHIHTHDQTGQYLVR
jgi:hypothetical protein